MEIIEERTIGPSLGAENIKKGFDSTLWGFAAIAAFMITYYMLFGLISVAALGSNLLFLVALLSMLQATLTLPGIAAIALALGMAIDANVLINERIREELRNGATPQAAIAAGYERAFDTIVDSNVTTLIVGLMLLVFRLRAGARLRRGALPRHPDLDLLGRGCLARAGEPDLRPPQNCNRWPSARSGNPATRHHRLPASKGNKNGIFRIRKDIPSCATRWCSTSSRWSPSCWPYSSSSAAACTSRSSSPAAR